MYGFTHSKIFKLKGGDICFVQIAVHKSRMEQNSVRLVVKPCSTGEKVKQAAEDVFNKK